MRYFLLAPLVGLVTLFSCAKDQADEPTPVAVNLCDTLIVSYSADIQPIFNNSCAFSGCHDNGTAASGFALADYNGLSAAASSPNLIGALKHASGFSPMPQGGSQIAPELIQQIECWIEQGTPNN